MRHGVGLLILTDIPKIGRVAVMQIRGKYNSEEKRRQYFAGGCQVTIYGGIQSGESLKKAIFREAKEELGKKIVSILKRKKLVKLTEFKRGQESGKIYATVLNYKFLNKICFGPDTAGIKLVTPSDLKRSVDLSKLKFGVKKHTLAIFSDTKKALKLAFRIFSPVDLKD